MTKQKIGLVIFIIGVIWTITWGVAGSVCVDRFANIYTLEELDQTAWASGGGLMMLWGLGGVPLGALIAGIGMMLRTRAKTWAILLFSIGVLAALSMMMVFAYLDHVPALFGVGGSIILLCFIGILWFWSRKRPDLSGADAMGADLNLVGYVFLLIAAWFTCGMASQLFLKAFEGLTPGTPVHLMFFFVLGWLFLLLGNYYSGKKQE
jgi:hypothetical protein